MRERNRFTLLWVAFSVAIFFHLHVVTLSYSGQDRKNNEAQTETKSESVHASVVAVDIAKEQDGYGLSVTMKSPDKGCDQYANWWEVLTEDGKLIFRRILGHSHVDEQPFTRYGGPVNISADTKIIIRGHMYPNGYGGSALKGTVQGGFTQTMLPSGFALNLEDAPPQPDSCAW